MVVIPRKRWDALDKLGSEDPTGDLLAFDAEIPRTPKEDWKTRGMSVQHLLNEGVTGRTKEWLDSINIKPGLIGRPTENTIPSIVELSQEVSALREKVQELKEDNYALQLSNSALQLRVSTLEKQLKKKTTVDNLWDISDHNLKVLEELSGFAQAQSKSTEQDPFAALKGLLAEYSDDAVDSVELVNSVRGK